MEIRRIRPDEVERLAGLDDGSGEDLAKLLEEGLTRPDWCFLAIDGGRPVGRVVYWRTPSVPEKLHLYGFFAETAPAGRALLLRSLCAMRSSGATTAETTDGSDGEERSLTYRAAGYSLVQEKRRFVRTADRAPPLPLLSPGLAFRTLADVGEDRYVEAIARVTVDTLDRDDRDAVRDHGIEAAAREIFGTLVDIDERPEWWRLAYDGAGALVGLVIPQRFTEELGALNYVGVAPEMRGRGYGEELLAEGTRVLESAGVRRIIGDIDAENLPLARALARVGYREEKTFRVWRVDVPI